jgi:hypothetical protein
MHKHTEHFKHEIRDEDITTTENLDFSSEEDSDTNLDFPSDKESLDEEKPFKEISDLNISASHVNRLNQMPATIFNKNLSIFESSPFYQRDRGVTSAIDSAYAALSSRTRDGYLAVGAKDYIFKAGEITFQTESILEDKLKNKNQNASEVFTVMGIGAGDFQTTDKYNSSAVYLV